MHIASTEPAQSRFLFPRFGLAILGLGQYTMSDPAQPIWIFLCQPDV